MPFTTTYCNKAAAPKTARDDLSMSVADQKASMQQLERLQRAERLAIAESATKSVQTAFYELYALRALVTEAAAFHARRGSVALQASLENFARQGVEIKESKPLKHGITAKALHTLYNDIDAILNGYENSYSVAHSAVQQLPLWRQTAMAAKKNKK